MNLIRAPHFERACVVVIVGALTLTIAACEERSSQDKFGQKSRTGDTASSKADRAADEVNSRINRAADVAERKLENAAHEAGKAMNDATITAKVKSALISEPDLKALSINVDTTAGVVTLKGKADNQENRIKAEQVAARVEGVRTVRNELVVVG